MAEAGTFDQRFSDLFNFFIEAERNNEEVTYRQIQEKMKRGRKTVRWYTVNFWSWFLHPKGEWKRGQRKLFICDGIAGYPEKLFIQAHKKEQGQYFYHFAGAMKQAEDLRKQKEVGGEGTAKQPEEQPPGIEQDIPKELNITDNEGEEGEDETEEEEIEDLEEDETEDIAPSLDQDHIQTAEPAMAITTVIVPGLSPSPLQKIFDRIFERMIAMFGGRLSEQDRALLGELRNAFHQEMQGVKQAIQKQSQQAKDASEQAKEEQEKFRMTINTKMDALTQEIRQHLRPDLSSIRVDIGKQNGQTTQIIAAIEQLPTPPDITTIGNEIEEVLKHYAIAQRLQYISERMSELQSQVAEPTWFPGLKNDIATLQRDIAAPEWLQGLRESLSVLQEQGSAAPAWLLQAAEEMKALLLRMEILQQQIDEPKWLQELKNSIAALQEQSTAPVWFQASEQEVHTTKKQVEELTKLLVLPASAPLNGSIKGSIKEAADRANATINEAVAMVQAAIVLLRETFLEWIDEFEQSRRTVQEDHEATNKANVAVSEATTIAQKAHEKTKQSLHIMEDLISLRKGRDHNRSNATTNGIVEPDAEVARDDKPEQENEEEGNTHED